MEDERRWNPPRAKQDWGGDEASKRGRGQKEINDIFMNGDYVQVLCIITICGNR
jgi:hypothetical protein